MRKLECIGFFVQMLFSPLAGIQRPAASILAELASLRECAVVMEQIPGFHEFIQANFCNQFGQLVGNNNGLAANPIMLQHVSTIVQKLREHRNTTSSNNANMTFY